MVPNVVVLDHHKSAIGTPIGGNVAGVVDMNRCGATIAFEYIEDGDLWRWKLPNSKAFSSGLKDLNLQGIGAVVYRVPELENDQMLKISLRSVDTEDTTLISQGELVVGGHRNASSFMVGSAEFKQWKL
ncbi:hypothetical protein COP2_016354 [Malus domestica]